MIAYSFRSDRGQAFPIYIVVVGGLLFLALAYFAVGQAAVSRNNAQGAADAAALAAAHDAQGQVGVQISRNIDDLGALSEILTSMNISAPGACDEAARFAARNRSDVERCTRQSGGVARFTVDVRTQESVGASVVPGTDGTHSVASATAAVDFLCALSDSVDEDESEGVPIEFRCRDGLVVIDPSDINVRKKINQLFEVRLVG
ncbi:pilus assembly protein TadG-related protein [Streptomyces sp. 549]|uniref:pilus assembly protein TadG-related protein n=1 Tax=Streptomyces sp. 549 TaxID=3049076 RepID=UPI0024C3C99C|nr:pilus assembly protein TadG-related protein [Streptomyces sp. 549]MDK1476612.1 pilus assembly protein TadG-related protein [Streptomyces sp. 549]